MTTEYWIRQLRVGSMEPRALAALLLVSTLLAAVAVSAAPSRIWVDRYAGAGNNNDRGVLVVPTPDGTRVFVIGNTDETLFDVPSKDYATLAYDAVTGARLWVAIYDGPEHRNDIAIDAVVSPDGTRLFVTGSSMRIDTSYDYVTIAYDTATGTRLWVRRYAPALLSDEVSAQDIATAIGLSPDGTRVFVTGSSVKQGSDRDVVTLAYDAASGERLWITRLKSSNEAHPTSLTVSPDGSAVYVAGYQACPDGDIDFLTVRLDATTGNHLWSRRYGGPANREDYVRSVVADGTGVRVFVTGTSIGIGSSDDYATVAYDATTGERLWTKRYGGQETDQPFAMAASPDGARVHVTGYVKGATSNYMGTVTYSAVTGQKLWARRYDGPAHSGAEAFALAISQDGSRVYVAGASVGIRKNPDYATVAYDATTGDCLWTRRYNGPYVREFGNADLANSIAVSADGSRVFVTGESGLDIATIAYEER